MTAALADGTSVEAREVVLAVPAADAASLMPALALPVPAGAPMRVVGLGYPRSAFRKPPSRLRFLATPGEADGVIGSIVSSNLFAWQAPDGHVLVRTFVGGAFAPGAAGESGIARVQRQLHRLFGVQGEPAFAVETPWPSGIPQYARGHMARVAAFERRLAEHPGLRVVRSALVGVGLEEAIAAGAAVARDVIRTFEKWSHRMTEKEQRFRRRQCDRLGRYLDLRDEVGEKQAFEALLEGYPEQQRRLMGPYIETRSLADGFREVRDLFVELGIR